MNVEREREHVMKKEFPFGIDPAGRIPEPDKSVTVIIEASQDCAGGCATFDQPFESVPILVGQVKLLCSPSTLQSWGSAILYEGIQSQAELITITGWNPTTRVLSVRLEKGALPISQYGY